MNLKYLLAALLFCSFCVNVTAAELRLYTEAVSYTHLTLPTSGLV